MKPIITLLTILFISFLSSPSWSETLTKDDLVHRNKLYYKKFTDVPFTGEVSGEWDGNFRNGKKSGSWLTFHENGQLLMKGNYKDGKLDGFTELYYENGRLESTINYKVGKLEGLWVSYYENGLLLFKNNYKDGKLVK